MKNFFAGVVYSLLYLVSLLPLGVHYFFSDILAFILKKIVRYRYSVITTNIARSFPDMKYGEIKKLTSRYYSYMCDLLFESIWDLAHSADAVRKRVSVSDVEVVDGLQKKYGRVILVMGHCGNWEMVSGMMIPDAERTPDSYSSNPTYMVYKAAESKFSDIIFKKLRMHEYKKFHTRGEVVESKQVLRHALKNKDEKCMYIMIADQNPIGHHDPVVNFLNQKTYMLPGPDFLASRLEIPAVYLRMDRLSRGRYHIGYQKICEPSENRGEHYVTKEFVRLLEEDIKRDNVNWLWSHKRWKRNIEPGSEQL